MILLDILGLFSTNIGNIFFRLYHYLSILFFYFLFHSFKKGPQGIQSIQGPPGPSIITTTNVYDNFYR